jgi:ComF family protein
MYARGVGKPLRGALRLAAKPISLWLAGAGDALASIFVPAECRLCERLLTRATRLPICDDCLASFTRITGCICELCGVPLDLPAESDRENELFNRRQRLCLACQTEPFHFDHARSFARYEDSLVRAIVLLKFEEMEPLADWFVDRLVEVALENIGELKADLVIPVPLHKERGRERGFNQAELLSKRFAKRLKLPHQGALLVRKRPRPDKHLLTSRERWEAVRGAFATRAGSQVDKQRVLLVDDVMTTGATLDACARALREAGASAVLGLTVARAILNPQKVSRKKS